MPIFFEFIKFNYKSLELSLRFEQCFREKSWNLKTHWSIDLSNELKKYTMKNYYKKDKLQNFKNITDLSNELKKLLWKIITKKTNSRILKTVQIWILEHLKQPRLDKLELKAATCNSAYNKLLNCE